MLAAFLSRHFVFEKTKIYTKFKVTFWSKTRYLSIQEKTVKSLLNYRIK